jgi:hypothetical protein
MLNKKAKLIEALHVEIAKLREDNQSLTRTLGFLEGMVSSADSDSKKDVKENKCVGNKCSKKTQNKKTVKTQPVANGNVKGRSGAKDVAGGKKGSKKTVKKS